MKIWRHLLIITTVTLCLLSTACTKVLHEPSFFTNPLHNRIGEYQKEENYPPLKVPPGMKKIPTDPTYAIPSVSNPDATAVSLLPPGSLALKQAVAKHNQPLITK